MSALTRLASLMRSVLLLCLGLTATGTLAEPAPLKLGIMPFNSPLALIKTHRPLTAHLEKTLGRRITVFTSPDYFTYVNQLLAGDFDLAIAGPHFGVMASERGSEILFRYSLDLQPVFIVRDDSPIHKLAQLRDKRFALSSRLSISSIGGVKWLQEQGLQLNRDYRLEEYSSHAAAVSAVIVGEADAAITTHTPLRQIHEDIRKHARILPVDIRMPHLMTLAHSRLGRAEIERIRQALSTFQDTPAGQAFFQETGYLGYRPVTPADVAALKPFVDLTVQMMRLPR